MSTSHVIQAEHEVCIVRELAAPRALVFQAWVDPQHLVRWYAPRGCSIEFRRIDPRPGGSFHSCIRTSDGHECWCTGVYREIEPPARIVLTMAVADAHGNAVGPADVGMDPDWPRETVVTVTFVEKEGRTTLTLHQTVDEALARRTGAYPSWLVMLDRLEELLTER